MIRQMLAIWSLVPLPFLKPAWTMEVHGSHIAEAWLGEFWALLYYCVRWVQLCSSLSILWHCLSLGLGMKTDLFQSWGHCWVFRICWLIECSTFTASSFRTWNSSAGIPSPPLALFIVMLPKAHWLHIPGCLALGEWSHHCGYLGHENLFCIVLLCILPPLLNIFCFC